MNRALSFILGIVMAATAFAQENAPLKAARKHFEDADALLNKTYQSVFTDLPRDQAASLRARQREWISYRNQKAESLLWFNGIQAREPKDAPEYWDYMTSLTTTRIEFLRVYSGAAVQNGISGAYSDFYDGDLMLEEGKQGQIEFSISVVRGRSAHTGEISGVAHRRGNKATFKEIVPADEKRAPCEIVFTFIDGHIVKVDAKNRSDTQGAGAYFDGLYYKTTGTTNPGEPAYRIDKSMSPSEKLELWVKPFEGEGVASGTAEIREVKTGRILSAFDWSGFGVKLRAPEPPFEIFWRKDSRYFAIRYEEARGWVTGAVYGQARDGRWVEVKLPKDEYAEAIKKRAGVAEFHGKGCESPTGWDSKGNLELLFTDRNLTYGHEDLQKEFVVTLAVAGEKALPLPSAKVLSIREKSQKEVELELQSR